MVAAQRTQPPTRFDQQRRAVQKIPVVLQCSAVAAWRMRPLLRIRLGISHSTSVAKFSLNVASLGQLVLGTMVYR